MTTKNETKVTSNLLHHKAIMYDILTKIYTSSIKQKIAFKWGTLCMFVYGLDRFSVDLDFDLVSKDISLEEVKNVIKQILLPLGTIKEETKTKIILKYKNDQIPLKLEINTRINKSDSYEVVNLFGQSILAMKQDCIFANKLVALSERHEMRDRVAARDLYDIYFFFQHKFDYNHDLILERTGKTASEYFTYLIDFIPKHFSKENVLRWLWELVSEKQKFWIKNSLVEEVLKLLKFQIWNLGR